MLSLTYPDYLSFSVLIRKPDSVPNISKVFNVACSELVVPSNMSVSVIGKLSQFNFFFIYFDSFYCLVSGDKYLQYLCTKNKQIGDRVPLSTTMVNRKRL